MTLVGDREYGTWKTGASIYKDSKGYYIVEWSPKEEKEYKKYLKGWKPDTDDETSNLCRVKKRWTLCKKKKNKSKSKTKRNKTRRHT